MVSFPPCKINLGLNILNKRPDGYHELLTCFFPVPWTDILEIIPATKFSFSSSGDLIPGDSKNNLCVRAYELLKKDFSLPDVHIHLHKIIPTGAGLGGGSSDAAHTLRMLNAMFEMNLTQEQMLRYASTLGSDCAFFLSDEPMLGSGRGEILNKISVSLSGKFLIITKPEIHVSTAEAYAGVTPRIPKINLDQILLQNSISDWRLDLTNDFEESVFKKYPQIEKIKKAMYNAGALYSSMSGSGSSVFGIFDNDVDLKKSFQGAAYWSGRL